MDRRHFPHAESPSSFIIDHKKLITTTADRATFFREMENGKEVGHEINDDMYIYIYIYFFFIQFFFFFFFVYVFFMLCFAPLPLLLKRNKKESPPSLPPIFFFFLLFFNTLPSTSSVFHAYSLSSQFLLSLPFC
jgi:hypothetical protein